MTRESQQPQEKVHDSSRCRRIARRRHNNNNNNNKHWTLPGLVFSMALIEICVTTMTMTTTTTMAQTIDLSCDAKTDQCVTPDNDVCESELGDSPMDGCERGDCWDCRRFCYEYHYDCTGCQENGCYWCPGDARCYNTDLYRFPDFAIYSCSVQSDYYSQSSSSSSSSSTTNSIVIAANGEAFTCNAPDSFFRYEMRQRLKQEKQDTMRRVFKRLNGPLYSLCLLCTVIHSIRHKIGSFK
jgi:hypothetical protein